MSSDHTQGARFLRWVIFNVGLFTSWGAATVVLIAIAVLAPHRVPPEAEVTLFAFVFGLIALVAYLAIANVGYLIVIGIENLIPQRSVAAYRRFVPPIGCLAAYLAPFLGPASWLIQTSGQGAT